MAQQNTNRKIICGSCGGEYDENMPKCPYCGTLNIPGAEKEYFEKLEDVREDMEELKEAPKEEIKSTLKKQTKLIKRVVLVTALVFAAIFVLIWWNDNRYKRDAKADYLWKQENYPKMTQWYDNEDYDSMMEFYIKAMEEDRAAWDWEHADFCNIYDNVMEIQRRLELVKNGETLGEIALENMFYDEWCVIGIPLRKDLDDEERQRLEPYIELADTDVRERYDLTEEEYNSFYEQIKQNNGQPNGEECYAFVQQKSKTKGEK